MKKRCSLLPLLVSAGLAIGAACPSLAQPSGPASDPVPSDAQVRARADRLLAQMTPDEKAGQLAQVFYSHLLPAQMTAPVEKAIAAGHVGGISFESDPKAINQLQKIAVEQSRLKIPLLFAFDVIHGMHVIYPVPLAMAASWDPALVQQVQAAAAAEARAAGITWTFAPMVDISPDPRWGRIVEGAGEDPYLGAAMARAQVLGFQGERLGAPSHLMATVKHFAAYGAAMGGRDYDQVDVSRADLWNIYFPPFKAAIDAGSGAVMSAYMPLNGVPTVANHWLLSDVLRKDWHFGGMVISDSNAVNALVTQGLAEDTQDAAVRAIRAGLDMELVPPMLSSDLAALPAAMAAHRIGVVQVDDAVRHVLEAKIRLGLFEHPYVDAARAQAAADDLAHLTLARVAAERSAVLLRNQNGMLPLDLASVKSIAVIGPLADAPRDGLGPWVFPQNAPPISSILQAIRAKVGGAIRVDYAAGVAMSARVFPSPMAMMEQAFAAHPAAGAHAPAPEKPDIAKAVALAQASDIAVLVLGESQEMIGEAASRSSLELPGQQRALLDAVVATGKPVAVVLMSARPLEIGDSGARAILDVWYPGSAAGGAVANLLFGDANPGGKLPFTWIRDAAQAPDPYLRLASQTPTGADQRYWNGTNAPVWPFGYGLSYTSFRYANLKIDKPATPLGHAVEVSVDLTNIGTRVGDEVAQIYIHQRYGESARPVRELKGFQRVTLAPGETQTLHFTLTPNDLRYWSDATGGWVQDATTFDVWVGGDAQANMAGQFAITR